MGLDSFHGRTNLKVGLNSFVKLVSDEYTLGSVVSYNVIEVGFEDLNVKLVTSGGEYVVKIFSKGRTDSQVQRYVDTIKRAMAYGVNHPKLCLNKNGLELYIDAKNDVRLIVMAFISGKTFYDLARIPTSDELLVIASEAVKINSMAYRPEYEFDGWAIPNMKWMYEKTKDNLSAEGLSLVQKAFVRYELIPLERLPTCFVHGDLIKTNVILGDNDKIYVLDFAVSNIYPRIQELAVMAANLMFDEKAKHNKALSKRIDMVADAYVKAGGQLSVVEMDNLMNYALPAAAMEYMGSVNERVVGDNSEEIIYWEHLGLETLREALF